MCNYPLWADVAFHCLSIFRRLDHRIPSNIPPTIGWNQQSHRVVFESPSRDRYISQELDVDSLVTLSCAIHCRMILFHGNRSGVLVRYYDIAFQHSPAPLRARQLNQFYYVHSLTLSRGLWNSLPSSPTMNRNMIEDGTRKHGNEN